jgi:amino acid permease
MSFVGSTGSTIISFILPGLFYFSLFRTEPGPTKWWALALAIYGVAVMCFWFVPTLHAPTPLTPSLA